MDYAAVRVYCGIRDCNHARSGDGEMQDPGPNHYLSSSSPRAGGPEDEVRRGSLAENVHGQ